MPKKEGVEAVGLRLHRDAAHKLKVVAAQRRTTFSGLVQEALTLWWAQQPEAKTEGELFPGETSTPSSETTTASEQSTPKKAAPVEVAGSVTKPGFQKPPKKGTKAK